MDLTVAICTYKRHDLLRTTLESLAACEPIDAAWEIIVVDNECHESVRNIVESFVQTGKSFEFRVPSSELAERHEGDFKSAIRNPKSEIQNPQSEIIPTRNSEPGTRNFSIPIRYIAESATGTSHARNRAVKEAAAAIVLFTDDDVTFDPHWLVRMWAQIQAQPGCAFWGGRVEPVWTAPRPAWFDANHCAMLGDTIVQYDRGGASRAWDAENDPPFYTANLALRIDAIRAAGGFDVTVGHRGDIRMGMEDSLMVKSIAKAGGRGWYVADAVVNHPVPAERMERKYARQFAWRQGWLSAEMTRRGGDLTGAKGKMPRWFYRVALTQLVRGIAQMMAGFFSFNAAKRFGGRVAVTFNFSKLWHAVRG